MLAPISWFSGAMAAIPNGLLGLVLTLACWAGASFLYRRFPRPLFQPVLVCTLVVLGILLLLGIPHSAYATGGQWLSALLGPCVVALALPLHQHWDAVVKHRHLVLWGCGIGCLAGMISGVSALAVLGVPNDMLRSMAPKSVTTPIAIELSQLIGGIPELTCAFVVLTGILGAAFGPELLGKTGIRSVSALGLAMGTSAHGIGTARLIQDQLSWPDKSNFASAFSALGMILNGVLTAIVLPAIVGCWF